MRLGYVSFLCLAFSLACAAGEDKAEDDEGDGSADGIDQSGVCADYLSCAASVAPDDFATLTGTYGPDGTCWASTQDFADTCTEACQAAVEALAAVYPDDEECEGYAPDMCALADGGWTFEMEPVDERCLSGTLLVDVLVDCPDPASGTFTIDVETQYGERGSGDCTFSDLDFTCTSLADGGDYQLYIDFEGSSSQSNTRASGTFVAGAEGLCESTGDFTASM